MILYVTQFFWLTINQLVMARSYTVTDAQKSLHTNILIIIMESVISTIITATYILPAFHHY